MGIMPDPGTYNNQCPLCFPANESPEHLKLFFGDIKTGAAWVPNDLPPPNGYWDIDNIPGGGCNWNKIDLEAVTAVTYFIGQSLCHFQRPASMNSFWAFPAVECVRFFTNVIQAPAGKFYGGFAFICTPAEMQEWIELVTPITGPDPRMELFPMDNDQVVLKFCNKQSATNVKIKLDTTLL